jgi:hypothetical protein
MKIWTIVTAVSAALIVIGLGALIFLFVEAHKDSTRVANATLERTNEVVRQLEKLNARPKWVKEVQDTCTANRNEMSCTFTNLGDVAVNTCKIGGLVPKQGQAKPVKSLPLCVGKLEPRQTRTVTAAWDGAFADEICGKDTGYGRVLDWSKCEFGSVSYTPPGVVVE